MSRTTGVLFVVSALAFAGAATVLRSDAALTVATYVGATAVVLSLVGFLRWVFVVPPLARSYARPGLAEPSRAQRPARLSRAAAGSVLGRG